MFRTIHRNFKQLPDAESARNALLAGGFRAAAVKLNPHYISAGHNIAIDTLDHIMEALTPGHPPPPDQVHDGILLSVDTDDSDQREQADAIMRRFGAVEA